jgi:putative DNA primase/helicase
MANITTSVKPFPSKSQRNLRHRSMLPYKVGKSFKSLSKKWCKAEYEQVLRKYTEEGLLLPPNYKSNNDCIRALKKARFEKLQDMADENGKIPVKLPLEDVVKTLASKIAFTVIETNGSTQLMIYDYDKGTYSYNPILLDKFIYALLDIVTDSNRKTINLSLCAIPTPTTIYEPLPAYKIAVGNGIFNCITQELENYNPVYVVTHKIETNYVPEMLDNLPSYYEDLTIEKLIYDLANGVPERIQLLKQIVKSVITSYNVQPSIFIAVGAGGDGKSTFFSMLAKVIGEQNTAYVNFQQLNEADTFTSTLGKTYALGLDNDNGTYIKKSAVLKSIGAHEQVTYSRKYQTAISAPFTATFVQLCNEMPRFAEKNQAMERRLIAFSAENSHTKNGDANPMYDDMTRAKPFCEHVLAYALNETACQYFMDYNDCDRALVQAVQGDDDYARQFIVAISKQIMSGQIKNIPATELYAAYKVWFEEQGDENTKLLSSRGFTFAAAKHLLNFGYKLTGNNNRSYPSVLESLGSYNRSIFDEFNVDDSEEFQKIVDANRRSRTFYIDEKLHEKSKGLPEFRRYDDECDVCEYFGVAWKIAEFGRKNNDTDYLIWADGKDNATTNETIPAFISIDSKHTEFVEVTDDTPREQIVNSNEYKVLNSEQHKNESLTTAQKATRSVVKPSTNKEQAQVIPSILPSMISGNYAQAIELTEMYREDLFNNLGFNPYDEELDEKTLPAKTLTIATAAIDSTIDSLRVISKYIGSKKNPMRDSTVMMKCSAALANAEVTRSNKVRAMIVLEIINSIGNYLINIEEAETDKANMNVL